MFTFILIYSTDITQRQRCQPVLNDKKLQNKYIPQTICIKKNNDNNKCIRCNKTVIIKQYKKVNTILVLANGTDHIEKMKLICNKCDNSNNRIKSLKRKYND